MEPEVAKAAVSIASVIQQDAPSLDGSFAFNRALCKELLALAEYSHILSILALWSFTVRLPQRNEVGQQTHEDRDDGDIRGRVEPVVTARCGCTVNRK